MKLPQIIQGTNATIGKPGIHMGIEQFQHIEAILERAVRTEEPAVYVYVAGKKWMHYEIFADSYLQALFADEMQPRRRTQ